MMASTMERLADLTLTQRIDLASRDAMRALSCLATHGHGEVALDRYRERFGPSICCDLAHEGVHGAHEGGDHLGRHGDAGVGRFARRVATAARPRVSAVATGGVAAPGRIRGLRKVPFNTVVPVQSAGGNFAWVAQGVPKPLTKLGFGAALTIAPAKASGIIAVTKELGMLVEPSAWQELQTQLVTGVTDFTDRNFLDPTITAIAGVRPASITSGVAATAAGTDPDSTLDKLLAAFFTALPGASLPTLIASAATLSQIRQNTPERRRDHRRHARRNSVCSTPTMPPTKLIIVDAARVCYADDGVEIDVSEEAAVQMDSAPDSPATAATVLVSFWQTNLVGFRVERLVSWVIAPNSAQWTTLPALP